MFYAVMVRILSVLLTLRGAGRRTAQANDPKIMVLQHQIRVLQRMQARAPRSSRWEKLRGAW